ncbi:MAG: CDP-2,3-bis-(O-geranylgeranyl)-sn-glycerol synthase [Candidatus Micrarchaeota archaeon]
MDASTLLDLLAFIAPAYLANASPVILGGGVHMDFGRKLRDGKRILGDGKTWRGFFLGILAGTTCGFILGFPILGFLLSFGTLVGDTIGSFIKRRMDIGRGKQSVVLDQLTFLLVALAFAYPYLPAYVDGYGVLFLIVLTYFMHVFSNVLAHRLGLKKVPW